MQTYSHFIITAAVATMDRNVAWLPPMRRLPFLFGSVLPDIPLGLLTVGYALYRQWYQPAEAGRFIFDNTYDTLYFTNPFWITGHNLFHSPVLIALYLVVGYIAWRHQRTWGASFFWLVFACGIHAFVDIITHVNDGPLLLFPLNWSLRFHAPFSYWDRRYGAAIVAPVEHIMDLGLFIYTVGWWIVMRLRNKATATIEAQEPLP